VGAEPAPVAQRVSLQPGAERLLQFPGSVLEQARSEVWVQQQQRAVQPVPRQFAIPSPGWRSPALAKSQVLGSARVRALPAQVFRLSEEQLVPPQLVRELQSMPRPSPLGEVVLRGIRP